MPIRKEYFCNDSYYHVMNKGVNGSQLYTTEAQYLHFIRLMDYLRFDTKLSYSRLKNLDSQSRELFLLELKCLNKPFVDIVAFCLMPNHFHILLRQKTDYGIHNFMRKLQNSYAKHFNTQQQRTGHLFDSQFKANLILNDTELLHISRYIHLNPVSASIIPISELYNYQWSSYPLYFQHNDLLSTESILCNFTNKNSYKRFVQLNAEYQRELQVAKNIGFE